MEGCSPVFRDLWSAVKRPLKGPVVRVIGYMNVYGFRDPLTDRNCKATTARAAVEGIEGAVTIAVAIAASAAATSKCFEMSYKIPR